jgi:hypothetical protein
MFMKRFLTAALVAGLFAVPTIGLVGCGEKSEVKQEETIKSPTGTTTTTTDTTIKSTGENPPANTAGQTAETPK